MEFHTAKAFAREEPRLELIAAMLESVLPLIELEFQGQVVPVDGFRLRRLESWRTANEVSLQQNLGSLSTACNCHCAFCYEDGNPDGLFEKRPTYVSVREAETRRRYLHDGKGLLRESKGFFEPLCNPRFLELMELVREQAPTQVIDITTNGAGLTPELVTALADLKPVYVNLSLISSDEELRRKVMGDHKAPSAIGAIELLRAHDIPFMGTMVPWPEQGLRDIEQTVAYLDAFEARLVRVSMPGLTRHHPRYRPGFIEAWLPQVMDCVLAVRERVSTPVILSPFAHVSSSMDPVVEGVIKRSPAYAAGMRLGDRLCVIDGIEVVSRSHASSLLIKGTQRGFAEVDFHREGRTFHVRLEETAGDADAYPYKPKAYQPFNVPGLSFGLCLPGSFHLQYLKQIHAAISRTGARRALVVASPFYRELVAELLAELSLPDGAVCDVMAPANEFFGGNVSIGDLWVLEDIARSVATHIETSRKPDLLILPDSFLNQWGRDLRGDPYTKLSAWLDLDVALIECEPIVL
jgi:uncharacterized Fe-S cluster-containing radical SAM superfamily protein